MIKGILIGILIYSFILTVVALYKDSSSYFMLEVIDVIAAGPVCWILDLSCIIIKKIFGKKIQAHLHEKQRRPYVPKTKKYIQKTVKKIVSIYKKSKRKYYFDFKLMQSFDCDIIEGWKGLLIKKPRNERINNKFSKLMYHQDDDTIEELKNYFNIMTVEEMKEVDSYRIDKYINKNLPIYKIKED
jgi:hypothetical protein